MSLQDESLGFSVDDAVRIARETYGLSAMATDLPGYEDRNFRLTTSEGTFVLKIAGVAGSCAELELQDRAFIHLHDAGIAGPRLRASQEGERVPHVRSRAGRSCPARLLSWVEGTPYARCTERPGELPRSFGAFLATLDAALASFEHPAAKRDLDWDFSNALRSLQYIECIASAQRRRLVERCFLRFEERCATALDALPQQVIHNDANDHNVLVKDGRVVAIIDFGDMLHTARVGDPAIALSYLMLKVDDPYSPARAFLEGYRNVVELESRELDQLADLIALRLAISVVGSTRAKRERPDDPYLNATEPHAWKLLERLANVSSAELTDRLLSP